MPKKKQNKQWFGVQIQEKQAQIQRHEMCKISQQKMHQHKKTICTAQNNDVYYPKTQKEPNDDVHLSLESGSGPGKNLQNTKCAKMNSLRTKMHEVICKIITKNEASRQLNF